MQRKIELHHYACYSIRCRRNFFHTDNKFLSTLCVELHSPSLSSLAICLYIAIFLILCTKYKSLAFKIRKTVDYERSLTIRNFDTPSRNVGIQQIYLPSLCFFVKIDSVSFLSLLERPSCVPSDFRTLSSLSNV